MISVNILGGSQTDFQRNWTKEGKGLLSMMREVVEDCLDEVKISYDELRALSKKKRVAVFVGNFDAEQYLNQGHLGAFLTEVDPAFVGIPAARFEAACASGSVAIDAAATKIRAGDYDVVIVLGIEIMKSVTAKIGADFLGTAAYYSLEAAGVDFPFPKLFSRLADITIEKYGLDEKRFMANLSEISALNYSNAKRNPKAQTRAWFMSQKHASNRNTRHNPTVGGRLCATDCSQITDGAAAVVLCSDTFLEEYAGKRGVPGCRLPIIKGWGCRVAPLLFSKKIEESKNSKYVLPWTRQAILDAYDRANISVESVDFFETHDCFTSSEYAAISAFGVTPPGREFEAIETGMISFQGSKPVNPSGGLIGVGHPVGASGVRMLLDLYKQVSGQAGDCQIKNAKNGAMLNIGGSATTNYVFIVGTD